MAFENWTNVCFSISFFLIIVHKPEQSLPLSLSKDLTKMFGFGMKFKDWTNFLDIGADLVSKWSYSKNLKSNHSKFRNIQIGTFWESDFKWFLTKKWPIAQISYCRGSKFQIPFESRPIITQPLFNNSKSGHVNISDPH